MRYSPALVGRADRSRRVRLFGVSVRNRRCPGTGASAFGDDGCRVRAQGRSGVDVHRPAQPNGAGVIAIVSGRPRVLSLSAGYLRAVRRPFQPFVDGIVRELHGSASVAVVDGGHAICLAYASANPPGDVRRGAGVRRPVHATAAGRVLLSLQPSQVIRAYVGAGSCPALDSACLQHTRWVASDAAACAHGRLCRRSQRRGRRLVVACRSGFCSERHRGSGPRVVCFD
jgi:hypothetical protein